MMYRISVPFLSAVILLAGAAASAAPPVAFETGERRPDFHAFQGVNDMSMTTDSRVVTDAHVHAAPLQVRDVGTPVAQLPALLQQLVEAIEVRDSGAFVALYTEDGIHEDVAVGVLAQGSAEIRAYVEDVWGQFPDFRFEPISGRQAGEMMWLEYRFSATDPESGRPFASRGVVIIELGGNLIRRSADYSDFTNVLVQLGQLVPVSASPEATTAP